MSKVTRLKKLEEGTKAISYSRGLPIDIEVNKLREYYTESKMSVGDFYPYGVVEELIGLSRRQSRFGNVIRRWKEVVAKATNIAIGTIRSEGFKILSEPEKVGEITKLNRRAANAARKAILKASRVDRKQLGPEEQATFDHASNKAAKTLALEQLKGPDLLPDI